MDNSPNKALVRTILEHAEDYPWVLHEIGLLRLRLDDKREYRLHVWDPSSSVGEPPIHDHPFDFTSTVIAGEMTNTRYTEDPLGIEYRRVRYTPPNEHDRRSDTVRLSGMATTLTAGVSTTSWPMSYTTVGSFRARSRSSGGRSQETCPS